MWSNCTCHGDQTPGHPWVHGLQNSETGFNDLRFSKLIIMNGKNLDEDKMADAHWFAEAMERGCKIVLIAPENGAPSTTAGYWIPIRPATDAALWLGVTKLMIDTHGPQPGAACPLCGFPTSRWAAEEQFPPAMIERITAEFSTWKPSQGACLRCHETYEALAKNYDYLTAGV